MKIKNLTTEVKKENSKPDSHHHAREEGKKTRIIGKIRTYNGHGSVLDWLKYFNRIMEVNKISKEDRVPYIIGSLSGIAANWLDTINIEGYDNLVEDLKKRFENLAEK